MESPKYGIGLKPLKCRDTAIQSLNFKVSSFNDECLWLQQNVNSTSSKKAPSINKSDHKITPENFKDGHRMKYRRERVRFECVW